MRASMTWFWCSVTQTNAVKSVGGRSKFVCFGVSARFLHGFKLCRGYDHWKDTAWRDSKNCREHFLIGWIFAHTLVIIYKCVDTFSLKRPKLTRFWTFFKKAVTNTVWTTLTKQKLLLEYTKWRLCLMSKKRLVTLILSIGIFLSLAATVFAAGQPRRYNENSTVKGTISQSFYQVNAKTDVAVW